MSERDGDRIGGPLIAPTLAASRPAEREVDR